jgi:acetoin utilization deacetylase AcuC-like enzyme
VLEALQLESLAEIERRAPIAASVDQLARVHQRDYVEATLAAMPLEGSVGLDPDTIVSPRSGEAALSAAGSVCAAVDAVMAGEADNAFCAVRPPGHHATPSRAMGFCLFNSVAVAAAHACEVHGLKRVAIVDFDVHHGNGTQDIFWDSQRVFYLSSHQSPLYPGTGSPGERGASGNIVNLPLPANSGSESMQDVYVETGLPALREFRPELLLVSAGFDAHKQDPLAGLNWLEEDYAWISARLLEVADEFCAGRLVSSLEGGYNLEALGRSVATHVGSLLAGPG